MNDYTWRELKLTHPRVLKRCWLVTTRSPKGSQSRGTCLPAVLEPSVAFSAGEMMTLTEASMLTCFCQFSVRFDYSSRQFKDQST